MVTQPKEATEMQDVVKVRRAAAEAAKTAEVKAPPTKEMVYSYLEARLKGIEDQLMARRSEIETRPEFVEPIPWWDMFALGPIQTPPFLEPSNVIQVGETAFIATILVVNPFAILAGPVSPLQILTGVNAAAEVKYRTGNLDTWVSSEPSIDDSVPITGVFNLSIQPFTALTVGIKDMAISARITTVGPGTLPFGGFASTLLHLDAEPLLSMFGLPGATPAFTNRVPLRFSVYEPG